MRRSDGCTTADPAKRRQEKEESERRVEMRFKLLDGSEAAVLVVVLFSYFDVLTYFCHVCLTTKSTHINKTGEYVSVLIIEFFGLRVPHRRVRRHFSGFYNFCLYLCRVWVHLTQRPTYRFSPNEIGHKGRTPECVLHFVSLRYGVNELRTNDKTVVGVLRSSELVLKISCTI
jgi:hypothetical protein